jgi:membrane protein DedA with SNARE-associated domain
VSFITDFGDQLLGGMLTYGYPILGIALLLGAIGVPVPATLVATVAGTLVADGDINPVPTLLVALVACVAGDLVGYCIGRFGGDQFARRHGRWIGMGTRRLMQAEALFLRWAGPTLVLSRSLVAIVAPAVNLLAGASALDVRVFFAYATFGRLLWVVIFVGLGYLFAGSADAAADLASSLSGMLGLLLVAVVLARTATGSPAREPVRRGGAVHD